jgi:Zn-dependent metalloprotease/chitodextrinase
MRNFFLSLLLLSTCCLPLSAQFFEGPIAGQKVRNAEAVRISERTQNVAYIRFNENGPADLEALLAKRQSWMPQSKGVLSFRLISTLNDQIGQTHRRYQMLQDGYPIEGAVMITHTENGRLLAVNGDFFNLGGAVSVPSLSEQQAFDVALRDVGANAYMWDLRSSRVGFPTAMPKPKGELVFAPLDGEYRNDNFRLAWKFDVYASKPLSRQWIFVDAQTGNVIHRLNRIHTADVVGSAATRYSGTLPLTTDQTGPGAYRLRETGRGGGIQTLNCNQGTDYLTATDFTDTDNFWNNVNAAQDEIGPDAHIGTEATYDYYHLIHNWNSFDNLNSLMLSFVHYDVAFGNAFWDGTQMTYGDGDGGLFTSPLTTFDICGHEITHGVTEHSAGLIYADESGALNESFSDIFGNVIEHWARPTQWSWLLGEEASSGAGIRSMEDPTVFQNPGCYNGLYWMPGNDVHYNSGVQNHWFYILTEGDADTNDIGNIYNVTGLGWTKAAAIAFRNLSVYLTPSSEYADARFYAIQSAADLYGPCTNDVIQTTNAWYAVGVGGQFSMNATAAFSALPHSFCVAPATVNFLNNSNSASSQFWDFGDGTTSTAINPSHTYANLGSYTVKLRVNGCSGLADSLIQTNYVVLDTHLACAYISPSGGVLNIPSCEGNLLDPGGFNDYSDNEFSSVTIAPANAAYITLNFNSFELEQGFDFLAIYDGPDNFSPLIGNFTGNTLPNGGTITSSGGSLTLEFSSDGSVTFPGYDIDFVCGTVTAAPAANFQATPYLTCDGAITFDDMSTNSPNSWAWTFGDGGTSTLQNPSHVYASAGTYTVRLIACNGLGCDTILYPNYIIYDPLSQGCSISTLPVVGTTTVTACLGTLMDDGGPNNYSDNVNTIAIISPIGATSVNLTFTLFDLESGWDYLTVYDGAGTGATSLGTFTGNTLPNFGLPFVSSGSSLTIEMTSDGSVAFQGFVANYTSTGSTSSPTAQFTSVTSTMVGQLVNFTDQSVGGAYWTWNFGDGTGSSLQNPSHTYTAPGVYTVTLRVTGASGCDDEFSVQITVGGVGIHIGQLVEWSAIPNPAHDQLRVKGKLATETGLQLRLMNHLGQEVYVEQLPSALVFDRRLDLKGLARGMYFLRLESDGGVVVKKVVLQ